MDSELHDLIDAPTPLIRILISSVCCLSWNWIAPVL